jgi:hypothetical protein
MVCRLSNDDKPLIPTWTSPDNSSILVWLFFGLESIFNSIDSGTV